MDQVKRNKTSDMAEKIQWWACPADLRCVQVGQQRLLQIGVSSPQRTIPKCSVQWNKAILRRTSLKESNPSKVGLNSMSHSYFLGKSNQFSTGAFQNKIERHLAENMGVGSANSNAFGATQVTSMCALSGKERGKWGGLRWTRERMPHLKTFGFKV